MVSDKETNPVTIKDLPCDRKIRQPLMNATTLTQSFIMPCDIMQYSAMQYHAQNGLYNKYSIVKRWNDLNT